jgi:hypothetical protein
MEATTKESTMSDNTTPEAQLNTEAGIAAAASAESAEILNLLDSDASGGSCCGGACCAA